MEASNAAMKELLLDTKGACFLCLQTIPTNSEEGENDEEEIPNFPVNLRAICRCLRINIKSLFLQVLGKDCPADLYSSDLSVNLCDRCVTVVKNLSQLAREFEELQMRMDYQVQQFHGILKSSNNAVKWEAVKEGMTADGKTEEALVEVRLVELLRREASAKGSALVRKFRAARCPIVQVERINTPAHPEESNKLETFEEGLEEQMLVTICKRHYKTIPLAQGQGQGFQCFPCGGRTFANPNARDHLFSVHPHFFFQNLKPENWSNEELNAACRHALQLEFSKARETPPNTTRAKFVDCIYCQHRLRNVSSRFHHHLVVKHYPLIKEKVVQVQRAQQRGNLELPSNLPVPRTRMRPQKSSFTDWLSRTCLQSYRKGENKERLECLVCHRKVNLEYAKKHICISHPEKLFERDRLLNVSEAQLKLCWKFLFETQTRTKKGNILKCPHCPWTKQNLQLFGNHLVWNHFPLLREKMKQYQEEKVWNKYSKPELPTKFKPRQNRATKTEFSVWLVKTCSEYYVPSNRDNKKRCRLCRKELLNGGTEKIHMIYNHPEKILRESKLESLTEEQFTLCCRHLFRVENEAVIYGKGNRPKNCRYCQAPQVHSQGYATHLVTKHFDLLEQKLKEYQQAKVGIKVERLEILPEDTNEDSEPLVEMQVYPEQEMDNEEIIEVKMENVMQDSSIENVVQDSIMENVMQESEIENIMQDSSVENVMLDSDMENVMQSSTLAIDPLGLLEAEKDAIKNILEQGIQNGVDLALD